MGHERQSVPQLRHRRLLRRRAAHARNSTSAGCRRRCSARTCACTASASASRGSSARKWRRSAASGSRSATGSFPISKRRSRRRRATACRSCARCRSRFPAMRSCAISKRSSCAATRCSSRPILRDGGDVEIALPPGNWYDLNTRQRFAGRQVIRYRAKLDQFPVFGREGHALPLGRAVQHTGEIDAANPLELLWVFGKPDQRHGRAIAQVKIADGAVACGARRQGRILRRHGAGSASRCEAMTPHAVGPRSAITSGEPAGIGPELVAMLAQRHAEIAVRRAPRDPRRPRRCWPRARHASARAALCRIRSAGLRARRRRRGNMASAARGAGHAGPARPHQRAQRDRDAASTQPMPARPARSRRSSPRRCRRA